jgi:Calcineurin-like phosphoesterase
LRSWPLILLGLALAGTANAVAATPSNPKEVPETPGRVAASQVPGLRVAAAGDIACAPGERPEPGRCRHAATARIVQRQNPVAVIALGDLQYESGSWADFKRSYDKSWGQFKAKTKPALGNHEYRTRGANGYYTYFGRKPPGYYTKTIGSWRLYVLNSNCSEIDCDRERRWLYNHMEAHPTRCSAIAMHHPRYSSGRDHGSSDMVAPLWRVAYGHGVDLALAGHDHDYERFAKLDGDAHYRQDGITSFVVGTGGKSLRPRGPLEKGSRFFRADKFGVLMLSLGKGEFSWDFHTVTGAVRDPGKRSCH